MELARGTVGFRSPRVNRRRISRRSLGEAKRDAVKLRRDGGLPVVDEEAQESRMDCKVGA